LTCYAKIQSKTLNVKEIINFFPTYNADTLLEDFLQFLDPDSDYYNQQQKCINASFFLGKRDSKKYFKLITDRKYLLKPFLVIANSLPYTLNHLDLRPPNAAETNDGSIIIYDWDDAMLGPAGLSLHALFSGCHKFDRLLNHQDGLKSDKSLKQARLLDSYVKTLSNEHYLDAEIIKKALPSSACAGMLQSLITYSNFPDDDESYIQVVKQTFKKRLRDLLIICDNLALKSKKDTLICSSSYLKHNQSLRSENLLEQYVTDHPNDLAMYKKLSSVYKKTRNWRAAISNFKKILEVDYANEQIHNNLGYSLNKVGKHVEALNAFNEALTLNPSLKAAKKNFKKTTELLAYIEQEKYSHLAPTIKLSESEMQNNTVSEEKLNLATSMFYDNGTVVIENVFPKDLIKEIQALVMDKYEQYFIEKKHEDALRIGNKRYMVTLDIEGPLNSPRLLGSEIIDKLMNRLLGEEYILGGLNSAVSLPGSVNQRLHKDHPALFPEQGNNYMSPPFAIGMLIPLVQMTTEMGPTSVHKKSHLLPSEKSKKLPSQAPVLDLGSCLLMDYRLTHQGLANRSEQVRPILCVIFHRPWFRDFVNYDKQEDVRISKKELQKVPKNLRHLYDWKG